MHQVAHDRSRAFTCDVPLDKGLLGDCSVQALQGVIHPMASHAWYAAVTSTAHIGS